MNKTLYQVLRVEPKSTQAEIRSSYRKLVLKYHPDQSSDPKSARLLQEVVEAYEVLGDPEKRRHYDATLAFEAERARRKAEAASKPSPPPEVRKTASARRAPVTDDLIKLSALFNKSRFAEAEALANSILERNPREAIPYGILGDIARARGNLNQAINMYAHAIQADPHNRLYEQRYEELLRKAAPAGVAKVDGSDAGKQVSVAFGGAVCLLACIYIALSKEAPILPSLGLISTWTLGLVVMLFLCGVTMGVALTVGGKLDRFGAVSMTSLGKISPTMALGSVAVVSFWAAALLYAVLGLSQNAFNYSTSRVISTVATVVCVAGLAAHFSAALSGFQVFLWGGNLTYIGAICGWMVADSLRG